MIKDVEIKLGDSITLMEQLNPESVDCIITDPPYGLIKHSIETNIPIDVFFQHAYRVLKPRSLIVFFGCQPSLTKWNIEASKKFRFKCELIWYKRNSSNIAGDIKRVYENISVFQKGTRKFNLVRTPYMDVKKSLAEFCEVETINRLFSSLISIFKNKSRYEEAIKFLDDFSIKGKLDKSMYTHQRTSLDNEFSKNHFKGLNKTLSQEKYNIINSVLGLTPTNLLSFTPHNKQQHGNTNHSMIHPTVKPVQLLEYLVSLCTNPDELVLDPFMGSGTTGVACINQRRKFLGIELFEKYFTIAKARLFSEEDEPSEYCEEKLVEKKEEKDGQRRLF